MSDPTRIPISAFRRNLPEVLKASSMFEKRVRPGLTILASGAILDATSRFGVKAHTFVVVVALLIAALLTLGHRPRVLLRGPFPASDAGRRFASWSPRLTAFLLSGVLVTAEVVRFARRGGHSGFPIWLSDLFHEDNSTWIFNGTSATSGNGLTARALGYGGALMQAALNGVGVLIAWVQGVPASSVGVAITGVGLSYVLFVAVCPILALPVANVVWVRTGSFVTASSILLALTVLLERFMREVRDIGHLSAGFAVLGLTYSALVLISEASTDPPFDNRHFGLWAFSFSCLLWFPLRPLALVIAIWALAASWNGGGSLKARNFQRIRLNLTAVAFFTVVALRAFPDVRSYLSPSMSSNTAKLLNARGGTYESFDFFLLITALLVGAVLLRSSVGTLRERRVLGLLAAYAIGIRFLDQMASAEFEYGSTKLLWITAPTLIFMSAGLLARDLPIERVRTPSWSATPLVLGLLLANSTSFYGTVRSLGPLIWRDVDSSFVELNNPAREDDVTQWDEPGGLELSTSAKGLPIVCVMVDERLERPIPLWEFEPYRCSRKMSEMSLEVLRNSSDKTRRLDGIWMRYALLEQPLLSAVMASAYSTNDLSRDVLVLSRDGEILRRDRVIDVLAQIALSDPVLVEATADFDGALVDSVKFNVDRIDLRAGELSLWADQGLERILLITDSLAESLQVERTSRSDVAELLGRSNLLSGVSFSHPSINENLRCVVLTDREGNGTLAWSAGGRCSP